MELHFNFNSLKKFRNQTVELELGLQFQFHGSIPWASNTPLFSSSSSSSSSSRSMGQVQSQPISPAEEEEDQNNSTSTSTSPAAADQNSSLDSLIAEAAAFGDDDENKNLSVEEKAQKALECPCIAHLRTGPCGSQFSDAFLCFLKSTAPEKGSDCVHPFVALQNCIKTNPDAFSKDILEDDEIKKKEDEIKKEEKPSKEYKVYPPLWSVESKKSKHKS